MRMNERDFTKRVYESRNEGRGVRGKPPGGCRRVRRGRRAGTCRKGRKEGGGCRAINERANVLDGNWIREVEMTEGE